MTSASLHDAAFLIALVFLILLSWKLAWVSLQAAVRLGSRLGKHYKNAGPPARARSLGKSLLGRLAGSGGFVARRLDPRSFSGLPLILTIAAAGYVAYLFGGLAEEMLEAEEVTSFDNKINTLLEPYRTAGLVGTFAWITELGDTATLTSACLVATGLMWAYHRTGFILPLWATVIGAELTVWVGKFGFDRERPDFIAGVDALSPAFPSAHATGSTAVYGFIAYLIVRKLPGLRQRFEVTYWTFVVIALIGFSRIFLSVHYTSDVAAGFLVGAFWLLVGFAITEHLRERKML